MLAPSTYCKLDGRRIRPDDRLDDQNAMVTVIYGSVG